MTACATVQAAKVREVRGRDYNSYPRGVVMKAISGPAAQAHKAVQRSVPLLNEKG